MRPQSSVVNQETATTLITSVLDDGGKGSLQNYRNSLHTHMADCLRRLL